MRRALGPMAALLLIASVAVAAEGPILPAPRRPLGASAVWRLRPDAPSLTVREPRVALQPVSPRELMAALQQPVAKTGATISGTSRASVSRAVRIQRRLEGVWTLTVPATDAETVAHAIDVNVEVVASSGTEDRLAAAQAPDQPEIDVRAVPLPPRLVSRQGDAATYEGSLLLELDLSNVRTSGTYSGTLVLTVNQF